MALFLNLRKALYKNRMPFGFIAEGIKGEEAGERRLYISHRNGYIDSMKMRSNIAKGFGRQEDEKYAGMGGKALAQDSSGSRISDNEYYKNAKAAALLAKLQAGNISNVVSTDGERTYSFRVGNNVSEISSRKTGRDEDLEGKFWELMSDTFGENNFGEAMLGAGTAAGGYLLNKKMGDPVGKTVKLGKRIWGKKKLTSQTSEPFNSSYNKPINEASHNPTNQTNNRHHEQSADTHNASFDDSSVKNITHATEDVKTPKGYEKSPGGILVPEGTLKNTLVSKTSVYS